jgi:hypothetical protein
MAARPLKTVDEIATTAGVDVVALGRDQLPYAPLDDAEVAAIRRAFYLGLERLRRVAPKLAVDIARQERLVIEFAAVAKATFPIRKNYAFPSVPGSLGVAWVFPQAIKYAATPSAATPCYTSYKTNSWDMDIAAGTPAWILGDGTNYYRTSNIADARTFLLIFHNGIVEYGTTPSVQQFRLISEAKTDYGIYAVDPLMELPLESGLTLYQYPTLGATWVDFNRGIMWGFLPTRTGTATIKLLGIVYYEHDFARTFKWVA